MYGVRLAQFMQLFLRTQQLEFKLDTPSTIPALIIAYILLVGIKKKYASHLLVIFMGYPTTAVDIQIKLTFELCFIFLAFLLIQNGQAISSSVHDRLMIDRQKLFNSFLDEEIK